MATGANVAESVGIGTGHVDEYSKRVAVRKFRIVAIETRYFAHVAPGFAGRFFVPSLRDTFAVLSSSHTVQ